jgi:hypothetical protein
MTVKRPFQPGTRGIAESARLQAETRVPRIAKLMALAICFDELIREGVVADQAELARVGRVSRARVTQIMDLLNLAPAIQEQLLNLSGSALYSERSIRPIAKHSCWRRQLAAGEYRAS